jgi:hypothetical protein
MKFDRSRPISTFGYIGYTFFYSLPVLGTIFLIMNALSARNVNVRNFSRSLCVMYVLSLVVVIALYLLIIASMGTNGFVTPKEIMEYFVQR